jgi:hypothetical protein
MKNVIIKKPQGIGNKMYKKTITLAIAILILTSTMILFNQNNTSIASTGDPSRLNIYAGPTSVLADNNTYNCIFVQLQDSSGQPARALQDTTISLSSSQTTIGTIVSSVTILNGTTYTSANFQTTFSPGTTTISATATGYATVQATVTTIGPIPSAIAVYGFPSTLPSDGNTYAAIMLQLQDSSGNPARAPQGGVQVTLLCSDTSVGTVSPVASISEGQTFAVANFTTTLKAQTEGRTETAIITAITQGYTPNQLTITTTPVATNPSLLKIFVGPSKVPADQNSYTQIAIELQNSTGFVATNLSNILVTIASNDQSICKIDSITIPQLQTYALATLNTTYKSGSATITAVTTNLLSDHQSVSTFGFIPSKLGIYCVPVNLPADNKTYQAIQVQLQDAQGRPAKDPQADVTVNLFSSQPTIGVVGSTLTIPFGQTQATGSLTVTNAPGTTTITAQASGYSTAQTSISTSLIDYSPLQITLTANPNTVYNGYTTTLLAYITANGAPMTGATISFASNNGGTFGSIAEQGNGYYNVSFTAPSFSATTSCTITASGSKTGYLSAQGTTPVTVNPAPAPTATPTSAPTATPAPTTAPTTTPTPTPMPTVTPITQTITLQITDNQGTPLNNTLVTSTSQPTGMPTLLQVTNGTGYVKFENTTAGTYAFKIIKQGYSQLNETFVYTGQPLTLTIPMASTDNSTDNNPLNNTNLIAIVAITVVAIVVVVLAVLFLGKRRKSPNTKDLQDLKKQMENKNKFS